MNCKFRAIAGALALCAFVLGASGCKKTQTPQGTQSPLPTLNEPHSHPDKPADSVPPQGVKVPHQHCGLKISLPEDATAAPSAEDKNLFNFQVKSISGTVRFGSLSELGKGTTSSLEYAKLMVDTYGAETTKEGTSTNVAFYALRVDGDDRYMYSLYTYKSPDADTTVCWLVEAKCHADDLQLMREIVGCCGWDAQQIPEL